MGWLISAVLVFIGIILKEPQFITAAGLFAVAGSIDMHK